MLVKKPVGSPPEPGNLSDCDFPMISLSRLNELMPGAQRRMVAQVLFLASGIWAALLFGGVETWAQGVVAVLLALACLLEATVPPDARFHPSKTAALLAGFLLAWLVLSLCPWPSAWASWLMPGQEKLLKDLLGWRPARLHGSMAPRATGHALFLFVGAGATMYLSWYWSASRSFRAALNVFILSLGVMVGSLGLMDRLDGSELLYGFLKTEHAGHWTPFINRNHFSNYLDLCALVGLGIFFRYAFPKRGETGRRIWGWLALIGAIFCMSLSVASASKGGLLALAAGLLVFVAVPLLRKKVGLHGRIMVIGLLFFVGFVLAYGRTVLQRSEAWMKREATATESDGRWRIWDDTWRMGLEMRGRGIGVGAFETVFPAFQTAQGDKTISHVENDYLQALVEWGWLGSLAWIGLISLLILRAIRTLARQPSEWQIAGWATVVAMMVHALVDFPLHIPANAWVLAVVAGMLCRSRAEEEMPPLGVSLWEKFATWKTAGLAIGGAGLLAGSVAAFLPTRDPLARVRQALIQKDYPAARIAGEAALATWPFYWSAHESRGYALAGARVAGRDVQRCFHRAQRLNLLNPLISFNAAALFLPVEPLVARDFFEAALSVADRPEVLLRRVLLDSRGDEARLAMILPLASRDPQCWLVGWQFLSSTRQRTMMQTWMREWAGHWLNDPAERNQIIGALIEGGMREQVLESFKRIPPRSPPDFYWQARALQDGGAHQEAAKIFERVWREGAPAGISFPPSIQLDDTVLRRAMLNPGNLQLQREVAASFHRQSRHADAIEAWERVLRIVPEDLQARSGIAAAHGAMGNWKKAAAGWCELAERTLRLKARAR